jgi:hemerythrin-like metal-binding protein
MYIDWENIYSIGIDEIDDQHMMLLELLDKAYLLKLQGDNQQALSQLVYELMDYAHYHFSTEEKLMVKHNYHKIDDHISEHLDFTSNVLSFEKGVVDCNNNVSKDVFEFIENWLFDHILTVDSEMGRFIRSGLA